MTTTPDHVAAPPIDRLLVEVVVALGSAARSYLDQEPTDTPSAQLAIDVAAHAFESIRPRLRAEESTALGQIVTDARLEVVRKRGV